VVTNEHVGACFGAGIVHVMRSHITLGPGGHLPIRRHAPHLQPAAQAPITTALVALLWLPPLRRV